MSYGNDRSGLSLWHPVTSGTMTLLTDTSNGHPLRAHPRRKVFHPVELRAAGRSSRAHILNLSGGGALAYCADPPCVGTALVFTFGKTTHSASVVWQKGRRFGVAFQFQLSDAAIDQVIAAEGARRAAALTP